MCWREPACVIHTHLSRGRCSTRREDSDWPSLPLTSPLVHGTPTVEALLTTHLRNKTVLLVGDSITESIWDFLMCESHREGLRSVRTDDTERGTGRGRIDFQVQGLRDAVFRGRVAAFWDAWFGEAWGSGGVPLAMDTRVEVYPGTHTILVRRHAHRFHAADVAALARLGDVLVFNYGLHYDLENEAQAEAYRADMRALAAIAGPLAATPGKAVLFRETTAQHFRDTGAFTSWEQARLKGNMTRCECLEMRPEVERTNKMKRFNDMAHEVLAGTPLIRLVPFYDFTARLFMSHEEDFCSYKKEYASNEQIKYSWCGAKRLREWLRSAHATRRTQLRLLALLLHAAADGPRACHDARAAGAHEGVGGGVRARNNIISRRHMKRASHKHSLTPGWPAAPAARACRAASARPAAAASEQRSPPPPALWPRARAAVRPQAAQRPPPPAQRPAAARRAALAAAGCGASWPAPPQRRRPGSGLRQPAAAPPAAAAARAPWCAERGAAKGEAKAAAAPRGRRQARRARPAARAPASSSGSPRPVARVTRRARGCAAPLPRAGPARRGAGPAAAALGPAARAPPAARPGHRRGRRPDGAGRREGRPGLRQRRPRTAPAAVGWRRRARRPRPRPRPASAPGSRRR